jgi:hypothetical protein
MWLSRRSGGPLPEVLVVELGHGDVEARAQAALDALQHLPLVLEGTRVLQMKFEREQTDRHGCGSCVRPRLRLRPFRP